MKADEHGHEERRSGRGAARSSGPLGARGGGALQYEICVITIDKYEQIVSVPRLAGFPPSWNDRLFSHSGYVSSLAA